MKKIIKFNKFDFNYQQFWNKFLKIVLVISLTCVLKKIYINTYIKGYFLSMLTLYLYA